MSRNNNATEEPTELEAAVLGVIWQQGPCTAYAIRKEFQSSASPRWSGSAGATYPLLRRLEKLELIESTENCRGKRKKLDYSITATGTKVLRGWVRRLDLLSEAGLVHDPLRSKLFFIEVLTKQQARKTVDDARAKLREQLVLCRRFSHDNPIEKDRGAYFAGRNMLIITRARIAWLDEVAEALVD